MWMEDFSVVFDYAGSAGIFRIDGLCFFVRGLYFLDIKNVGGFGASIQHNDVGVHSKMIVRKIVLCFSILLATAGCATNGGINSWKGQTASALVSQQGLPKRWIDAGSNCKYFYESAMSGAGYHYSFEFDANTRLITQAGSIYTGEPLYTIPQASRGGRCAPSTISSTTTPSENRNALLAAGLELGGPKMANKFELVESVRLTGNLDDQSFDAKSCAKDLISSYHSVENVYGSSPSTVSRVKDGMTANLYGADYTFNGLAEAAIYRVPYDSKELEVCFAYFEDALMYARVKSDSSTRNQIISSLSKKYGEPSVYVGSSVAVTSWKIGNDMSVKSMGAEITFEYIPVLITKYRHKTANLYKQLEASFESRQTAF
jgi:hypothetical protein